MATPWVILGRIVRADHAAAAAAPDFTLPVAPPPGVTFLAAGRSAHLFPNRPDESPYIIAAGPSCLLAHFAVAPSTGKFFGDDPQDSYLVVVRDFHTAAGGLITASAERIPNLVDPFPILSNIWSVGLISHDDGHYVIVELQVDSSTGIPDTLFSFERGSGEWNWTFLECPLPAQELQARKWLPHGAVSIGSTLWWFDLRWGILSCDLSDYFDFYEEPDLVFTLPPAVRRRGDAAHVRQRCITVSQGQLRYVEIIRPEVSDDDDGGSEAATVHMWTRIMDPGQEEWLWDMNYSMSFVELWKHASYRDTGLPRIVPQLAVVCPSDPHLLYFTLKRRLFGVNVHERRVVHHEPYQLTNKSVTWPQAVGRFVLAWDDLPPAVAAE
ncbi:hypothetical protein SETIT_4G135400v2 [Setaria italica]|uniref:DUF1618 domain-containing protein n=1 Tax=Setaria italica TaxID=4555 RepID=A0A368QTV4_SETIT|nr:hypothetical protein SETIT_4G135400v2 [Setaria italica]